MSTDPSAGAVNAGGPAVGATRNSTGRSGESLRPSELLITLVRCGSIRFTAYYTLGFTIGFGAPGDAAVVWSLGIVYLVLFCLAVELLNRITDQVEDAVNRPERTALCRAVGFDRLRVWCRTLWLLVAADSVLLVLLVPRWSSAAAVAVNGAIGVCYSAGPALKAHRHLSVLALSTTLSMPVVTGWTLSPDRSRAGLTAVCAVLLALVTLTTGGIKDITDSDGDAVRGYQSLWVRMAAGRRLWPVEVLLALQLVIAVAAVPLAGAALPIAVTAAALVEAAVVVAALRASTAAERDAVRETMHTATLINLVLVLAGTRPGPLIGVAGACALAWWVVASRRLHWNRALSWHGLLVFAGLLVRHESSRTGDL